MTDEELIECLRNNPTDEEAALAATRLEVLLSAGNSVNKEIINNKGHVRHSAATKLSAALSVPKDWRSTSLKTEDGYNG